MRYLFLIITLFTTLSSHSQNWIEIWSDEFDYTGLPDPDKWNYDIGGSGWGNSELQYYTAERSENARVESGNLIIEAIKESYQGSEYTSARLKTLGLGDWEYGKVEVRAQLPTGTGMWPAIWMLPSESVYGTWPNSGEIDIMENVGYQPDIIHWTVHTESYNHTLGTQEGSSATFTEPYNNFYTYGIEWYPDSIRFLVDGVEYFQFDKQSDSSNVWPFDQKFHLILNIAVGGTWGGASGVDDGIFPQQMLVDYVRVYKLDEEAGPYTLDITDLSYGTATKTPDNTSYTSGSTVLVEAQPDPGFEFNRWHGTIQNTDSNLSVDMYFDVEQIPEFTRPGEMLINTQYLQGTTNWGYYGTSFSASNGEMIVPVAAETTNPWDIQLSQDGFSLVNGESYTMTLVAYASENRSLPVYTGLNESPWTSYAGQTVNLTTTPQTFTIPFTMTQDVTNARVFIDFGGDAGDVYIQDFSLVHEEPVVSGLKNVIFDNDAISPNPFTDEINIEQLPDYQKIQSAQLCDMQGKCSTLKIIGSRIPVESTFVPGTYILRLEGVDYNRSFKVVKK